MKTSQLVSLSYEALKERRFRTALTALMVVMGASLIVSLNGVGNGFTNFVNDQFSTLGANVLILSPRGENIQVDIRLANRIADFHGVDEVIPYIQQICSVTISQGDPQTSVVIGVEQSRLPLIFPTISFEAGAFVADSDRVGTVVGNEAARFSGRGGELANLGQTVKINYQSYEDQRPVQVQRSFVIRGVLKYIGSGIVPADQMVFISIAAAESFFDRGGEFDGYYVITEDPDLNDQVRQELLDTYGSDLIIVSPQMIANTIQQITNGIYLFINIVAMVSLLVASVGIVTTIQTSMMERIKEIGLLKALGFNRTLTLELFLSEAAIIGIIGGSIGVLLGIGLSYGMSALLARGFQFSNIPGFAIQIVPSFDVQNLVSTWFLCVFLSLISGFYPSWRASRLHPVDALRHE